MRLRPLEGFQFFQRGDRLYTSESDVYRRQILTYKDGPRTERVEDSYLIRPLSTIVTISTQTVLILRGCVNRKITVSGLLL